MANPFFNAAYYLAQYSDLVTAGVTTATAEQHYDAFGAGELRAPNPWFDANAYLLANTDLIANGVTAATALAHFAAFGATEGRIFNNNPDLAPSNFSAKDYASANTDVASVLGITDLNAITPLQHNQLMAHYLAYGAAEGRQGVNDAFAKAVAVAPIIVNTDGAVDGGLTVGTAGNDTFVWDNPLDAAGAGVVAPAINGLDGVDTLKLTDFKTALTDIIKLVSVENISAALTGASTLKIANGADVESISTTGAFGLTVDFDAGVSATNDALAVSLKDAGSSLTTNGIEVINATLGEATGAFGLTSNKVNGTDIDFNLAGGKAGVDANVTVESVGSSSVTNATIDGSSFVGNLKLAVGTDLGNVKNIDITTGAGDDSVTLTATNTKAVISIDTGAGNDTINLTTLAGQTATVNAGAGNDTINASVGTDILTGGAGTDNFAFAAATDAAVVWAKNDAGTTITGITANDVITDFSAGDTVTLTGWVATGDGAFGTVGEVKDGVLTFKTGELPEDATLFDALGAAASVANANVAFQFGSNTYLFINDGAVGLNDTDALVQLTGVTATDLDLSAAAIVYIA